MPTHKLDRFDRKLLEALQTDGRAPNTDLAEGIDLSPSPCSRRVRLLEESGVIKGYSAILDQEKVGLGLTVFVGIKMERHQEKEAEAFCEAVSVMPEVVMAHLVSGESDFLLQVVVPDLRTYKEFLTRGSGHSKQLCDPDCQTPTATSTDSFARVNRPPEID